MSGVNSKSSLKRKQSSKILRPDRSSIKHQSGLAFAEDSNIIRTRQINRLHKSLFNISPKPSFPTVIFHSEPILKYAETEEPPEEVPDFLPFRRDKQTPTPHLCIWEHLSDQDMQDLNELQCEKDDIEYFLRLKFPAKEEKENGETANHGELEVIEETDELDDRKILFEILSEAFRYSRLNKFDNKKASALISIFYHAHQYFMASLWSSVDDLYVYIKEFMLLHTVMRPPKSAEIFTPEECRSALMHFVIIYLRYLPLLRLLEHPIYEFTISWQPEPEPELDESQSIEEKIEEKPKKKGKNNKKGKKEISKKGDKQTSKKGKGKKKKK